MPNLISYNCFPKPLAPSVLLSLFLSLSLSFFLFLCPSLFLSPSPISLPLCLTPQPPLPMMKICNFINPKCLKFKMTQLISLPTCPFPTSQFLYSLISPFQNRAIIFYFSFAPCIQSVRNQKYPFSQFCSQLSLCLNIYPHFYFRLSYSFPTLKNRFIISLLHSAS